MNNNRNMVVYWTEMSLDGSVTGAHRKSFTTEKKRERFIRRIQRNPDVKVERRLGFEWQWNTPKAILYYSRRA